MQVKQVEDRPVGTHWNHKLAQGINECNMKNGKNKKLKEEPGNLLLFKEHGYISEVTCSLDSEKEKEQDLGLRP